MKPVWASRSVPFLQEIHNKVVKVSLSFSKQTSKLKDKVIVSSLALNQIVSYRHNIAMPVMKPNCGVNVEGAQCSLKAAYETRERWLETALAHNQFIRLYLSFVSFIHSVVLHTKFMTRCHQSLSYAVPDDILC